MPTPDTHHDDFHNDLIAGLVVVAILAFLAICGTLWRWKLRADELAEELEKETEEETAAREKKERDTPPITETHLDEGDGVDYLADQETDAPAPAEETEKKDQTLVDIALDQMPAVEGDAPAEEGQDAPVGVEARA